MFLQIGDFTIVGRLAAQFVCSVSLHECADNIKHKHKKEVMDIKMSPVCHLIPGGNNNDNTEVLKSLLVTVLLSGQPFSAVADAAVAYWCQRPAGCTLYCVSFIIVSVFLCLSFRFPHYFSSLS